VTLTAASAAAPAVEALRRSTARRTVWLLVLVVLVLLLCVASVAIGARTVSLAEVVGALQGSSETVGEGAVLKRLPRTVLAALVGAALAVAGTAMRAVRRSRSSRASASSGCTGPSH
jgi:iron complex transport system permease protein